MNPNQESPLSPSIPSVAQPLPDAFPAFSGFGIEMEYMIVHRQSLDIQPLADELLRAEARGYTANVDRGPMGWSNELALHVVEIKNRAPHPDLAHLARVFQAEVRAANARLAPLDAQLMPGGMHPWMSPAREARLWHREPADLYRAYDRIFGCRSHGWVNVQSVHLNLPFANDLEFARLHAAVRLALPILPALAASSPLADGRFTGFLDYRLEAYRTHQMRIPATMGDVIPDNIGSRADYETQVLQPMYREIAPHDPEGLLQHEWLNARAAIPRFDRNAIEIRILDVQECPQADLAIAAAAIALIRRLYSAGAAWLAKEGDMETEALRRIFLATLRDAGEAIIDNPAYLSLLGLAPQACRIRDVWAQILNDMAAEGEIPSECLPALRLILEHGCLAQRILDGLRGDESRSRQQAVYRMLCQCLQEGKMYLP